MIRPKVKITQKNKDGLKKFQKRFDYLEKNSVWAGIFQDSGEYEDGTPLWLVALWNEYGTEHTTSKGTTYKIQERSFLRSAMYENVSQIQEVRQKILKQISQNQLTPKEGLNVLGLLLQTLIQNKIRSNVPPENAPSVQAKKRREGVPQVTLIMTGKLLNSIEYRILEDKKK